LFDGILTPAGPWPAKLASAEHPLLIPKLAPLEWHFLL
jgi:hypothetical protein